MPTYRVKSTGGGDGTGDGSDWTTNAILTLKHAVESHATSAGDVVLVSAAHSETLTGDYAITASADIRIICVDDTVSETTLATTALIGVQTTSYYIYAIDTTYDVYIYGIQFRVPGSGSAKFVGILDSDGGHVEMENCAFKMDCTSQCDLVLGSNGIRNEYIRLIGCSFNFGASASGIVSRSANIVIENCSIDAGSTAPTTLIKWGGSGDTRVLFRACDLSKVTGTLVGNNTSGASIVTFENCKLGLNVTMLATPATVLNKANASVYAFNCALDNDDSSYDEHFHLYHGDAFGETYVTEDVYCNTGAAYDGTNRVSWQVITRASNCSYYTPYTSPWIDVYHSGTSAITPYLEILRSGSTTKYQDDEVWSEWSYQGTSGSTKATFVDDRMTPLGTAADQTASSLGASDWTGEDATNNAYMKLESGSITPAEIGHIRARAVVGEPNITVYVDPYIRGLT